MIASDLLSSTAQLKNSISGNEQYKEGSIGNQTGYFNADVERYIVDKP